MAKTNFIPVILAGGSGTRLWPASREAFPKQFFDLTGEGQPLLASAIGRVSENGKGMVVTIDAQKVMTRTFLDRAGFKDVKIVCEPQAKNTAAAVYLACVEAQNTYGADAILGIFPADHIVHKEEEFKKLLNLAIDEAAKGHVVTLGIQPDSPSTAYGYIQVTDAKASVCQVERFIEKPELEKAKALIASGKVFWNAGMFVFKAQVMRELFDVHLPEIAKGFAELKKDLSNLQPIYSALPSISIDYGIMEKIQSEIRCIPAEIAWSDVGSWEEVSKLRRSKPKELLEIDSEGNDYVALDLQDKQVVCLGISDTIIVDTPDALVLCKKGHGQDLKKVVAEIRKSRTDILTHHAFEERPWGRFEILMDLPHAKSKRIIVSPGQRLSYQSHKHRSEHWTIVKGMAEVTLDDEIHKLKAGEHIYIPLGAKHRIANTTNEAVEFIEVQTGTYFGEDDIVRYSDDYDRQ